MSILTNEKTKNGKRTSYAKLTSFFRKLDNQIEAEKLSEKKKFIRTRNDEDEMV